MPKAKKKDYRYRSTWKHQLSRARNLAHRGGLPKKEMLKKYGRFPTKKEWWGVHKNEKEWMIEWIKEHPKPEPLKSSRKTEDKVVQGDQ